MSTYRPVNANGFYELYDGNMVHKMPSIENELSSPGGPALYPPGSPKPGTAVERLLKSDLEKMTQSYIMEKKKNEDLEKANAMRDSGNGEEFKDTQIRHLSRQVTIHQAEVYKKEQKLEEVEKEKKDVEGQLSSITLQYEAATKETQSLREHIRRLEEEITRMVQKEKAGRLTKETRDSLSPPSSSSHSSSSISLQSWTSNPNYAKELEVLHSMVDSLKQTVIKQRKVFEKFGLQSRLYNSLPQAQIPRPTQHSQHQNSISSTPNLTMSTLNPLPVRQTEETSEGARKHSELGAMQDDVFNGHVQFQSTVVGNASQRANVTGPVVEVPASIGGSGNFQQRLSQSGVHQGKGTASDMLIGMEALQVRLAGGSSDGGSPRRNQSDSSMSNLVTGIGGLSMSGVGSSSGAVNSEGKNDGIYINIQNPNAANFIHQREAAGVTKGLQNGRKDSSSPKSSPRKTSQTEIINRRPQLIDNSSLPVKYGTENLGRNPNLVAQHLNDGMLPQQLEGIRPPYSHDNLSYPRDNVTYPPSATTAAVDLRFHTARLPHTWPYSEQPCQRVPETHFGTAAATYAPTTHSNTVSDINSSPHPNPGRPQDDRLCPVCNQNLSHISMEDFQTHVFDCFDSENGPETLQPEMVSDYPPVPNNYRTCPMCQDKFQMTMSQTEFEQHVHRHFGEERFEVIS